MHVRFKTERFRQVLDDDEIDRVVLGEDCIEWLRAELSGRGGVVTEFPVGEDWGYTMAVTVDGSKLWINAQDWSFQQEQTWHVWIEPRGILARMNAGRHAGATSRLRQLIGDVLAGDSAIRDVRWSDATPT